MQADQLRQRRLDANLTQAALAKLIGVTANTVARWERGEVAITVPMARLLALVLKPNHRRR